MKAVVAHSFICCWKICVAKVFEKNVCNVTQSAHRLAKYQAVTVFPSLCGCNNTQCSWLVCACVYVEAERHPCCRVSQLATDPPAFHCLSIPTPLSSSVYPFLRSLVQIGARLCSHALALTIRRGIGIANFPSFVRSFSLRFSPPPLSLLLFALRYTQNVARCCSVWWHQPNFASFSSIPRWRSFPLLLQ